MDKKFRAAVIGCGRITAVYKKAFKDNNDIIDVVGACDKVLERAESFASEFPGCKAFTNFDEMLALKPDVVHVLTPHFLHREHVEKALKAGCNVLTEKPIGISMDDARSMIKTYHESGMKMGVIFQNRYIEGIQEVKRLIETGAFGKLLGAWSHLAWFRPASYYQCDWKGYWDKEGGGVVIDQAIHSIDLVRFLMDCEVTSIDGHYSRRILKTIEVEDEADAAITFENGAVYSFFACNYYKRNSPIRIEILGEKGRALLTESVVEIELEGKEKYKVMPKMGENVHGEGYWGSYHTVQVRDYYEKLSKGEDVPFSPEDAAKTLAIVLGIYASQRQCKPVIPENI